MESTLATTRIEKGYVRTRRRTIWVSETVHREIEPLLYSSFPVYQSDTTPLLIEILFLWQRTVLVPTRLYCY